MRAPSTKTPAAKTPTTNTPAAKARAALRDTLIALAEDQIAREGIGSLRARELAKEAGCSVGAIYNAAGDIPTIILHVNTRTFAKLAKAASDTSERTAAEPPAAQLRAMAHTYLDVAHAHPNLWLALFDFKLPEGVEVPEWYVADVHRLFEFIAPPLRALNPALDEAAIDLLSTTLFSAVHGIVLLGLENRVSQVPKPQIAAMIDTLLSRVT